MSEISDHLWHHVSPDILDEHAPGCVCRRSNSLRSVIMCTNEFARHLRGQGRRDSSRHERPWGEICRGAPEYRFPEKREDGDAEASSSKL